MMKVIKSHDLCPNLFHIEQLGNCLAGLLTPIVTLQKVCEKYYLISGESNVAEDQSGRATYIVFFGNINTNIAISTSKLSYYCIIKSVYSNVI